MKMFTEMLDIVTIKAPPVLAVYLDQLVLVLHHQVQLVAHHHDLPVNVRHSIRQLKCRMQNRMDVNISRSQ